MSVNKFSSIQINLASPERILEWSYGEVKKPETINYRSQKPERDGLFCEKIFGPSKDWECYCGKYKKVRYKGVICDRCGVEVTKSSVRRERMGHISLAAPVAHIWYLRGIPSRMGLLLDVTPKQLEEVVYFVSWIVTDPKDTKLEYKKVLSEREYRENVALYGAGAFEAKTGAEAVKVLLEQVDVEREYKAIQDALEGAQGEKRNKLIKRLDTVNAFRNSDNNPEWMVLTELPVIPPDLRPMLQLDGGRFATSDLNDLYRRVITRNNRLKKLLELGTPAIIVQNEKRMLQEAVDALIDNGRRSKPITGAGGRALKSLSHSLKGKQGRFRQNLLGKRVDFSGRSVIAVGPDLKMYQCGIPREMAIQLFKPYVINEIVNREIASNHKTAEKLIDKGDPRIWDIVEDVIEGHPVLLNRAPTLHRLGIQAYLPKLVEGRAIRLHPLVCPAFNADFDGDQMAVHVPLSEEARAEAYVLMLGSNNILGPKDGKPIVTPSQDMVLGNFYLTMEETKEEFYAESNEYRELGCDNEADKWKAYGDNEGHAYNNINEVMMAYEANQVHLHTRIALHGRSLKKAGFTEEQNNSYLVTTVGKVIFNNILPKDFPYINEVSEENFVATPDKYFFPMGTNMPEVIAGLKPVEAMKKKDLGLVIGQVFKRYSTVETSEILDEIKNNGFKYSTVAGITVSLADIEVAPNKKKYVDYGREKAAVLMDYRKKGKLTMQEWERLLNKLWDDVKKDILIEFKAAIARKNPINMMATSGARGNDSNFTQLAGMRGLMARPSQSKSAAGYQPSVIEVPIYSSFREGLNVSEFFTSTHGVRKGLTDTALKTAESGYLTRRLVDVAQDVVVREEDCGTDRGYLVEEIRDRKQDTKIESLFDRLVGRYTKDAIFHPETGELIIEAGEFMDEDKAQEIVDAGVKQVMIRSAFTCQTVHGVCKKCYGRNMATGEVVEVGESVGTMAAQSIGEPGTQLTMRTFHTGGVAGGGDITQGLPRVEELFEARSPKGAAVLAKITGDIVEIKQLEGIGGTEVTIANETESIVHKVGPTQSLRAWLIEKPSSKKERDEIEKNLKPGHAVPWQLTAGDKITEGQVAPKELLEVAGVQDVQQYILKEVKKVYASQGIDISDKHIEIMIRQMLRRVEIIEGNDTGLIAGEKISLTKITKINRDALLSGKRPAVFRPTLLGISKASVQTDSFLSAASFQETTKVLTDAAINGSRDHLVGLKENVIIGKLIPAGTGLDVDRESTRLINEKAEELRAKRIAANTKESDEEDKLLSFVPKELLEQDSDAIDAAVAEDELSIQEGETEL
ncbi:DNA-directed RNA polymerase subunit beta' [Erysipelotrichaceae bacterium MTC7]|nr:DNA-directed RNA polymerase subunit beta' [Erysipelotrichaceae bacterium MTC7]